MQHCGGKGQGLDGRSILSERERGGFLHLDGDLDLDIAPGPVGLLVGGDVANRILRPDLAKHLLVDSIEILDAAREECRPPLFRNVSSSAR